ncbi:MAG: hypothetical protein RIQ60_4116 [Pseudomonadota bacterium]|jgi:GrpB-like predicted nucleotidyltransferase (UPF0157 family)
MVKLIEYSDRWPAEYEQFAARLCTALDRWALRVDHIGSTAVPGLRAKDVLDIQVTVAALDREVADRMLSLGCVQLAGVWRDHRPPGANGPDQDWQKMFFREPHGERRVHVHVRELGRPNQRYALLFRDFLRAHPPMAAAYGALKQRLAAVLEQEDDYSDVKDPAVDLIYLAAERWAELTFWRPMPGQTPCPEE